MKICYWLWLVLLPGLLAATAQGQETLLQSKNAGVEIIEKEHQAFFYQGADMRADVKMELIAADGKKRIRVMSMLRWNDPKGKNQKYYIFFSEPADVRGMTFMVWKYPNKESDRWIYVPSLDFIRRIAARDARSSFVGSDFTYEDISGRNINVDTHRLLREEKLGDRNCYVVESVPKEPIDYVKQILWIDKTTFLPVKVEYYNVQNELERVFTADKIEEVAVKGQAGKNFPTITRRTMKNLKTGHRTEVNFASISYNVGLQDNIFTERYLRNPPDRWIR